MVSVKDLDRTGRRNGKGDSTYRAAWLVPGLLCDYPGADMEEAAEKYCPCGTSVSGMCVSYLYRKWGFFFETFGASAGYKQENGLQRTGVFSCNERRCRVLGQNIREGSRGQAFLCREK